MEDKQKPKIENEEISVRESTRISNLHQRDDAPVHIDDFVDAVFIILKNNNVLGEIINIASGIPVPIRKVIKIIVDTLKSGQPQFGQIKYRDGENMKLYADISKVKTLLNWKPKVDLETGILKTIESIKSRYFL